MMSYLYLPLALACLAVAFADEHHREFATVGGLLIVADAISRFWPKPPSIERKPPQV